MGSVTFMSDATGSQNSVNEFERWANVFAEFRAFSHPSELHGVLCGRLCAGDRIESAHWLEMVSEHMGVALPSLQASNAASETMAQAYDEALALLNSADLSFRPLLPDDDYAIEQRLGSLVAWVQGFLQGLALTAGSKLGQVNEEIRELLEDLVAISQLSDEEEASDENEHQLVEIVEYVRVAALTIFTEFNEPEAPANTPHTLH